MLDFDAHRPVLLQAVLAQLAPAAGERVVDATFGRGGYSAAILETAAVNLLAVDRDPDAIAAGAGLARVYPQLTLCEGCFGELRSLLEERSFVPIHGIVFDLGVSSPQLDDAERGFSFRQDGPLDMRMGRAGMSAADVVNGWSEVELGRILREFGEERYWRRVARAIVARRCERPFARTLDLAECVRSAVPRGRGPERIDPATRSFQALRIAVNDELGELIAAWEAAERVLAAGGRLVCVSFHSMEDSLVKPFLKERSTTAGGGSRHFPGQAARQPTFELTTRRPITADADEVAANPRARSAKLRAARRLAAEFGS
ncbi:MAG: 16S rRNA (cytosine(1402)-N(4))-methyltransferase RsmH [Geminicoccaceae bacterium]